jgi:SAM-dependent methyltransferase
MSWNAGYVADVPYVGNYVHAMSPSWMTLAAIAARQIPPDINQTYRYLDLGCGYATTLLPLAAANPHAEFIGVDFMPEHVAFARRVTQRTGLKNVTVIEASFEDILQNPEQIGGPVDFVMMHGVYTWVSPQTRQEIRSILQNHVKPGGLVYAGYNAHPGWTQSVPIQHLLFQIASQHQGTSVEKVIAAARFIKRLQEIDAPVVKGIELPPSLKEAVEDPDKLQPWSAGYLAHEYLNEFWQPMFFTDICKDFAEAKLSYVGGVRMMDHVESSAWNAEQKALIAEFKNPIAAESIMDMLMPSGFRRDVFARGHANLSDKHRHQRLMNTSFALTKPLSLIKPEFGFREHVVKINDALAEALATTLADGPASVAEIIQRLPAEYQDSEPAGIAAMLMDIGIALPVSEAAEKIKNAADFNMIYIAESQETMPTQHIGLASPVLGAGKAMPMDGLIAYRWLVQGRPAWDGFPDELIAVADVWEPVYKGLGLL